MAARIGNVRRKELYWIKRNAYALVTIVSIATCLSTLMGCAAFVTYHWMGHQLTADVVFPVMYLLGVSSECVICDIIA